MYKHLLAQEMQFTILLPLSELTDPLPHKGNCHFLNLNFEHFRRKPSEAEHLLRTQDDFDVTLLLLNRSQCKYDRKCRTKKAFYLLGRLL